MGWPEAKQELVSSVEELLVGEGYKFIKSPESYQRKDALEKRFIFFGFVAKKDTLHDMRMWCGIQNAVVEEVFHRTSGIEKKNRRNYTVVNVGMKYYVDLEGSKGIERGKSEIRQFIVATALPFLEKAYTIADYSQLLNSDTSLFCPYHGNIENRYHYGLICAKLAGDPCYATVKEIYAQRLQQQYPDFRYYKERFRNLIADLER
jgi:hypothetical protein